MLQTGHKAQERTVILEWISTQGYTNKHSAIRMPRVDGTGQWLLDHTTFRVWRDDIEPPNNVLWCHGNPGTGKSVLASLVIDHLQESSVGEDSATLFAYFDYRDQENQSSDSMTASLLQQIAAIHMDLPEAICNFYNKFKSNGIKPRLQDLEKALLLVCRNFERVFVVIDALDECEERQHRQTFMRVLQTLRNQPKVKLFITSRPHAQDIKTAFTSASQIMIEAKDSDLRRYLSTKIENSDVVELIDEYFKIEIVNKVTDRANKMFLLPALQIQSILNEPSTGEMEDALQRMPRTLHEAFDETIARIRRQPEGRRRLAIHILMWLSHAKSPLTITELSEALAIRIGQPSLNRRYCPSQKLMIECCLGLVIVDEESSSVRLAHFSIQEYLKDRQTELFPSAEDEITEKCLTYLFLGPLSQGCCDLEENIFARLYDYPFLRYAASYWGHHLRRCETEQAVKLAISFLNSQPRIAMSTQICKFSKGLKEGYWVPREVNSVTGLHVASYFGLLHAARNILDSGDVEIDAQTQMGTTPLINAASAGFIDVVRFLLLKNANPRKANWYGTALHCAAEAGKCGAIRVLLDTDMAIDYRDAFGRTSLHCAVDMGHTRAARLLLDRGADPNAQDHDGETPIHYAKEQDCSEHVLPMLLEHVGNSSIKV